MFGAPVDTLVEVHARRARAYLGPLKVPCVVVVARAPGHGIPRPRTKGQEKNPAWAERPGAGHSAHPPRTRRGTKKDCSAHSHESILALVITLPLRRPPAVSTAQRTMCGICLRVRLLTLTPTPCSDAEDSDWVALVTSVRRRGTCLPT